MFFILQLSQSDVAEHMPFPKAVFKTIFILFVYIILHAKIYGGRETTLRSKKKKKYFHLSKLYIRPLFAFTVKTLNQCPF